MEFFDHTVIETVRLNNHGHGEWTAYVLDRLETRPTLEQVAYWEERGAIVSQRHYRYAPEIVETIVFVPDSVMKWACPDEDCSGLYMDHPAILERDAAGGLTCPRCVCSTSFPAEDACLPMIELV